MAAISELDIGRAAEINSNLSATERLAVFDNLRSGDVRFVFVAPEQLANAETRERLATIDPQLFVVDEAHCISA